MDLRKAKIIVNTPGGTASKNSKTYKISLPSAWINEMGISETRDVEMSFDGKAIVITKTLTCEEFVADKKEEGHNLIKLSVYADKTLCAVIFADFTDKTFVFENYTKNAIKLPFGNNATPTWENLEEFLSERCIPKQRSGLREYLEAIGLSEYNTIDIIRKTHGRMAEDNQWIEMEEI